MNDKLSILDRFALKINPKWAYNRMAWRIGAEQLRNYDAGDTGRLNGSGWTKVNTSAQQTDRPYRDTIRARARDLERNSDFTESIVLAYERNVIGRGFRLQSLIKKDNGEDDEEINQAIEDLWIDWNRKSNCDLTGQQSLTELLRMAMRRLRYDGGILFVKIYDNDGILPFKLQAREVDELDTSYIKSTVDMNKNVIIDGIEYDPYHKPVAYYFKTYSPDGFWVGQSERVTADRVIFLWDKRRPSQVREMSPMANSMTRIRDTNEYMTAVSVQARILACLSVFIKKITPSGAFGRAAGAIDESSGHKQATITPGMIEYLQPGEEAQAINPSGQSQNAKDYLNFMQRITGGGQGLSYEAVSRDMSQVNYSSARQGLLEDKRTYQQWQDYLIEHFLYEVYLEFMKSAVLDGKLKINAAKYFSDKSKYTKHKFITSGWDWIDPLKEAKAYQIALSTCQTTLSEVVSSKGGDWKEVMNQKQREIKYAEQLGISAEGGITVEQGTAEETGQ